MRHSAYRLSSILAALMLVSPLIIIFLMSFDGTQYLEFPPRALSFTPYESILNSAAWRSAFEQSVIAAAIASVLAVAAGLMAALGIDRLSRRYRKIALTLALIPLIIPEIVLAIGQDLAFSKIGLAGSIVGIGIGQSILGFPLVVVLVLSGLGAIGRNLEDAAASLGARPLSRLIKIILPSLRGNIMAGALFAFLASFDNLLISLFLAGNSTITVPVKLWNAIEFEATPSIAAVSTIIMLIATLLLFAGTLIRKRGEPIAGGNVHEMAKVS